VKQESGARLAGLMVAEAAARRKARDEQEKADRQRIEEKAARLRGTTK